MAYGATLGRYSDAPTQAESRHEFEAGTAIPSLGYRHRHTSKEQSLGQGARGAELASVYGNPRDDERHFGP